MTERDNLEVISIGERITLNFIIKTLNGQGYGPDCFVLGLGYEAGSCECSGIHSGYIKSGEIFD